MPAALPTLPASVAVHQEFNVADVPVSVTEQGVQVGSGGVLPLPGTPAAQHREHPLHVLGIVLLDMLQLDRWDVQGHSADLLPRPTDDTGHAHQLLLFD